MPEPDFVTWEDWPSRATPINATTLNRMTAGVKTALSESRISQSSAASSATSAQSARTSVEASLANISTTIDGLVDAKITTKVPPLVTPAARKVKYGGIAPVDVRLDRLTDAILNPGAKDTRVVVLGSSTANGGNTPYREQGWHWRLAYRCGATSVPDLPAAAIPAQNGLRWFNGALGGTQSSDYAPAARLTQVNTYVRPQYVFHMVGSNDWRNSVTLATYKANVKAVLASIEAANPSVVNILVHQQERRDWSTSIPWASYGQQLADLAAEKPASRIYIDVNEFFRQYDLGGANRFGLVSRDLIHMGGLGHLYMANAVGSVLGIPSESDFGVPNETVPIAFPASNTYGAGVATVTSVPIPAAGYPRMVSVRGAVYMRPSANACEFQVTLFNALSGGSSIGSQSFQFPIAGGSVTQSIPAQHYLPPRVDGRLELVAAVPTGQTLYVSGTAAYSAANAFIEAI